MSIFTSEPWLFDLPSHLAQLKADLVAAETTNPMHLARARSIKIQIAWLETAPLEQWETEVALYANTLPYLNALRRHLSEAVVQERAIPRVEAEPKEGTLAFGSTRHVADLQNQISEVDAERIRTEAVLFSEHFGIVALGETLRRAEIALEHLESHRHNEDHDNYQLDLLDEIHAIKTTLQGLSPELRERAHVLAEG